MDMRYELKLDLDNPVDVVSVGKRFVVVKKFFQIKPEFAIVEKTTRHGRHVTITFDSEKVLRDEDICFLQLLLGSDWRREMFNWLRVRSGCKKWNVLFKKKYNSKMQLISKES